MTSFCHERLTQAVVNPLTGILAIVLAIRRETIVYERRLIDHSTVKQQQSMASTMRAIQSTTRCDSSEASDKQARTPSGAAESKKAEVSSLISPTYE